VAKICSVAAVLATLFLMQGSPAQGAGPDAKEVQALIDKAHAYLQKHQETDGGFSPKFAGPGVSAVIAAALLRNGYGTDDPVVAGALSFLEKSVKKDGGIYDRGFANYTTSVALMALAEANKDGKYDTILKNGARFLKGLQYDESGDDVRTGGVDYGEKKGRPDLSNTTYFLDALLAAGVPKDDPAVQRALKFVGRCQNLPGETNDQPFAKKTSDDDKGGLTYVPIVEDESKYKTAAGGLRSLGAMTYGGLKSFLYAGVDKKDPRVQGAINWIRRHYTLEENPGLKQAGLYYYYHTFAKALAALGEDPFADSEGVKHDWRTELFKALEKRQRPDGGFVNAGDRTFGEADPNLATGFALLALSYARTPAK
jgi:squalene-hopene/tetraprenyl-beta-curcumene cyclase